MHYIEGCHCSSPIVHRSSFIDIFFLPHIAPPVSHSEHSLCQLTQWRKKGKKKKRQTRLEDGGATRMLTWVDQSTTQRRFKPCGCDICIPQSVAVFSFLLSLAGEEFQRSIPEKESKQREKKGRNRSPLDLVMGCVCICI